MPPRNQNAVDFLTTRRSCPAKLLKAPYPDRTQLETLLSMAARTPDHGKLEPWRFIVLQGAALTRLADLANSCGAQAQIPADKIAKLRAAFADAGLVVAVIAAPKASDKVPQIEQIYSAGAVCLALVNAALASGWGANWLTGWAAFDETFTQTGLGLAQGESVAGFIHLGSCDTPPPERPRPNLPDITQWVDT